MTNSESQERFHSAEYDDLREFIRDEIRSDRRLMRKFIKDIVRAVTNNVVEVDNYFDDAIKRIEASVEVIAQHLARWEEERSGTRGRGVANDR